MAGEGRPYQDEHTGCRLEVPQNRDRRRFRKSDGRHPVSSPVLPPHPPPYKGGDSLGTAVMSLLGHSSLLRSSAATGGNPGCRIDCGLVLRANSTIILSHEERLELHVDLQPPRLSRTFLGVRRPDARGTAPTNPLHILQEVASFIWSSLLLKANDVTVEVVVSLPSGCVFLPLIRVLANPERI